MRRTFRTVKAIQLVSGWTWDDATGATITPELESSWAAYVKVHKDAKPFKNRGWRHFHLVAQIMPSTVRGVHVYCPSDSTVGIYSQSQVVDDGDSNEHAPSPPLFDASQDNIFGMTDEMLDTNDETPTTNDTTSNSPSPVDSDDEGVDITQVSDTNYIWSALPLISG